MSVIFPTFLLTTTNHAVKPIFDLDEQPGQQQGRNYLMKSRVLSAALATTALVAFANAAAEAPKGGAKGGKSNLPAPEITTVSSAVTMPVKVSNRGSATAYPFAALTTVGMSFGIKNRSRKNMTSIVSNANRKALVPANNADGSPKFKTKELTGGDGTKTVVPTDEREMVASAHYVAVDVDAKTDPDGASVRVFRDK
jgi:hypothetical protein